ncbi:MAG: carboxylate-amine ligase [Acidiferrobacteraceae bacterium]|jgi:carboxylate-amine ligase|nr:carboxylate-amine ligase [Acidiferrobacteraceae bacterium]MCP4827257.1 carboxylate-amine ligase [Pseudomonadota bacterium]HJP06436.1 carboxylate-amine ligase [Arenicellales bacterium]
MRSPSFSIGVEEEYLMVDRQTRDLIRKAPQGLMSDLSAELGQQVSPEFLQCQVEVGTKVCQDIAEVRAELASLRQSVSRLISGYGLELVAASTHPWARPEDLEHTPKSRYDDLERDLQQVARRLMICGMHVHVGIEHDELRMDLLDQMAYVIPHLLALSGSSPFWEGQDTGLQSYRIAVWDEMPRTGLPEAFESFAEYNRHVEILSRAGIIQDATKIWWDLRPSARFPTLELRVTDVCTSLEDAVCLAALYRCWLRMLYRLRAQNQRWRRYARMLIAENRWRAQRYGCVAELLDFGRGTLIPYAELLEEMLELVAEDAEYFNCQDEVAHARVILSRGSSSQRQLEIFYREREAGASREAALVTVVDWLISETKRTLT